MTVRGRIRAPSSACSGRAISANMVVIAPAIRSLAIRCDGARIFLPSDHVLELDHDMTLVGTEVGS